MALETFNYLDSLNVNNPTVTDGIVNGDDHIRGIKLTLKNTFPTLNGAVTATLAEINSLHGGVTTINDNGVFFNTNNTDGFKNPVAGEIDLQLAGTAMAKFTNVSGASATFQWLGQGGITSTGPINGPGITPIGGMIMWLQDSLPTTGGVWAWANGGTLSRTQAGNGLELYQAWSANGGNPLRYGAGDGVTTFNVIDMSEVVPVGKSTMGAAAERGLLNSITSTIKTVMGGLFGSDQHTLTAAEIPAIVGLNTNTQNFSLQAGQTTQEIANQFDFNGAFGGGNGGNTNTAVVGVSGYIQIPPNTIAFQSTNTGGAAHNITQPSRVVGFIIRIA